MIHNPENVESPGPGYRFLTVEERLKRVGKRVSRHISAWIPDKPGWANKQIPWNGSSRKITYRTKLTPEELEAEG